MIINHVEFYCLSCGFIQKIKESDSETINRFLQRCPVCGKPEDIKKDKVWVKGEED